MYVAIPQARIDCLRPWLSPRPEANEPSRSGEVPGDLALLADDLIAQGLLTADKLKGKVFEPTIAPRARPAKLPRQTLGRNALRFTSFYQSCRTADKSLSKARIAETIDFVRNRKAIRATSEPVSRGRLLSLVSTFLDLRLFYPRPYLCLFDSLALIEYLAAYRIFPTWVFGVQGEPFRAHCWVQYDDMLLDDSAERVSKLTPIMIV